MIWIIILLVLLAFQFAVLLAGAPPYLPTLKKQREQALDLLDLKPGETLIDLGSGDGAMLVAAARRGLKVVGYEINPLLFLVSWIRTRRYGKNVKLVQGNFWHKDWPPADAVFVFLNERYMKKLDGKMGSQFKQPIKLVTYGFAIEGKKPITKKGALFLYKY